MLPNWLTGSTGTREQVQLGTGSVYCQLFNIFYPNTIKMSQVKINAN